MSMRPAELFAAYARGLYEMDIIPLAAARELQAFYTTPAPAAGFRLALAHTCTSAGCADAGCELCEHNPHRACGHLHAYHPPRDQSGAPTTDRQREQQAAAHRQHLAAKAVVNAPLAAPCGAPIRIELVRADGAALSEEEAHALMPFLHLELRLLEAGNEADDWLRAQQHWDAADPHVLFHGPAGRETRVLQHRRLTARPLDGGSLCLRPSGAARVAFDASGVFVATSTQKVLGNQRFGQVRLAARAVQVFDDVEGALAVHALEGVAPLVTQPFYAKVDRAQTMSRDIVLATVDDEVKHIRGIGDRKVKQLLAFHASGHVVPDGCECITDVAQLQAALFANPNAALVSQEAADIVRFAPPRDERVRAFYQVVPMHDSCGTPLAASFPETDALFVTEWDQPLVALLYPTVDGSANVARGPIGVAVICGQHGALASPTWGTATAAIVARLAARAPACWAAPGHPGWALFKVEGRTITRLADAPQEGAVCGGFNRPAHVELYAEAEDAVPTPQQPTISQTMLEVLLPGGEGFGDGGAVADSDDGDDAMATSDDDAPDEDSASEASAGSDDSDAARGESDDARVLHLAHPRLQAAPSAARFLDVEPAFAFAPQPQLAAGAAPWAAPAFQDTPALQDAGLARLPSLDSANDPDELCDIYDLPDFAFDDGGYEYAVQGAAGAAGGEMGVLEGKLEPLFAPAEDTGRLDMHTLRAMSEGWWTDFSEPPP